MYVALVNLPQKARRDTEGERIWACCACGAPSTTLKLARQTVTSPRGLAQQQPSGAGPASGRRTQCASNPGRRLRSRMRRRVFHSISATVSNRWSTPDVQQCADPGLGAGLSQALPGAGMLAAALVLDNDVAVEPPILAGPRAYWLGLTPARLATPACPWRRRAGQWWRGSARLPNRA